MIAKHRILWVDDEKYMRTAARLLLDRSFEVVTTSTAEEARDILGRERFDLLITDFKLPGADGVELIEGLREQHPETPCILLSAWLEPEVKERAARVRAATLAKPCDAWRLTRLIEEMLDAARPAQ